MSSQGGSKYNTRKVDIKHSKILGEGCGSNQGIFHEREAFELGIIGHVDFSRQRWEDGIWK